MSVSVESFRTVRRAHACWVAANEVPLCQGPIVLATAKVLNPSNSDFGDERSFAIDLEKIRWQTRKQAVLAPSGELRAE